MPDRFDPPRRLRVENVARRTSVVWLFTMAADDGSSIDDLQFEPGQVAVLSIPDFGEAYMAIASPPDQRGRLEFLVKRTGEVGERLCDLGGLANVELTGLVGEGFPVDRFAGKDLVFIAAGTAIAPVRAAIGHAISHRAKFGKMILVHGVRRPEDFAVDDEIDRWREAGVEVVLTVTQPGQDWNGKTGRVQELLENAVRDTLEPVAFVCGSAEMMMQTEDSLLRLGLESERVFRNF